MIGRARLVALLLFGSGFCALIYQTTWLREFRLVFGASTAATAAVIGVFMAGLGVGGIILGRRSETKARPLAFYAKLELLIAASAAVSPFLIWAVRYFYVAVGGTATLGIFFGSVVRLLFAALILAAPTFFMGGTLPAAVRAVVSQEDLERRSVGFVYGANTLGAVAGACMGTFYLFENFGNRLTLWLAALVNVGIALIALRLAKGVGASETSKPPPRKDKIASAASSRGFVLAAAAIVGFAFFLMELVWYRMLGPLLGGSTFSFGLILAIALLGIGVGGLVYGMSGLKRLASLPAFATTCGVEALLIALPYALGDRIAMAAMLLRPLGTLGFYGHVVAWSTLCFIVIFPAALIAGVQFPLLIALLGEGKEKVGSQTGAAYAWNTIGALAGSLAGGFGFLPLFSALGVWKLDTLLLAALCVFSALLSIRLRVANWKRALFPIGAAVLALALLLMATGPTAFWRHSEIGVGRLSVLKAAPNEVRDIVQGIRLRTIWETDGVESSVALTAGRGLAFVVNGRTDGNAIGDAGTQIMSGLIGVALHPNPTKALVVGLGTGSTAGWLAAVPSMERVDVVELEPAVRTVAERCAPVNQNALKNPKLHLTIGDAREVLLTSREKYDIVVSEPSNPYRAGVAGLFTREYYQSVDRCLNPGGMFFQWVQAYDIDQRTIQIFYSTLGSVFSNIESWQTAGGDILLMASHSPVHYDAAALSARLSAEPLKSGLSAAWRATGLEDFLGHYVGNQAVAQTLQHLSPVPLNTDDRTVIEFAFARSVGLSDGFRLTNLRASSHAAMTDRPRYLEGEVNWPRVNEARLSIFESLSRAEEGDDNFTTSEKHRASAFAAYMSGDLSGALHEWQLQSEQPSTLSQIAMIAECFASEGDSNASTYIDKLAELVPWEADAIRAELSWRQHRPEEAADLLQKCMRGLQDEPWANRDLIKRTLNRVEVAAKSDRSKIASNFLFDTLRKPFCAYTDDPERLGTLLAVAVYLEGDNPGEKLRATVDAFEPHILWRKEFLQVRKDCYSALHDPRAKQAERDLEEFRRNETATADVLTLTRSLRDQSANSGSP